VISVYPVFRLGPLIWSRPSKSGAVPVVHHALRMLAAGAAWRIRATLVVILAALRRISDAIGGSKSSGAKQHGRRDQRNE